MTSATISLDRLADQLGMAVIRFRDGMDCLSSGEGEVLRLFSPRSVRAIGGSPRDRIMSGYVGFVLRRELQRLRPPSEKFERANSLTLCPVANFPKLFADGAISDGVVQAAYAGLLKRILGAIPETEAALHRKLGADFFEKRAIERVRPFALFVREAIS